MNNWFFRINWYFRSSEISHRELWSIEFEKKVLLAYDCWNRTSEQNQVLAREFVQVHQNCLNLHLEFSDSKQRILRLITLLKLFDPMRARPHKLILCIFSHNGKQLRWLKKFRTNDNHRMKVINEKN